MITQIHNNLTHRVNSNNPPNKLSSRVSNNLPDNPIPLANKMGVEEKVNKTNKVLKVNKAPQTPKALKANKTLMDKATLSKPLLMLMAQQFTPNQPHGNLNPMIRMTPV